MRRTLHRDFDYHACWVCCVIEVAITRNEWDKIDSQHFKISGSIELIDVSATIFEGYDDKDNTLYRLTRETITPDWLEVLDRIVTNAVQDDIDNQGPISDELWSYA